MEHAAGAPWPMPGRQASRKGLVVWCAVLVAGLLLVAGDVVAFRMNIQLFYGSSDAMRPTFERGSRIVTETIDGSQVRHGDVIVYDYPQWRFGGPVLSRVIGVGGDRVTCAVTGKVTVNGKPLDEPYVLGGVVNGLSRGWDVTVPPGRLFLLGDHRVDSFDSRFHLQIEQGTVPASDVLARATTGPDALVPYEASFGAGLLLSVAGLIGAVIAWSKGRRRAIPGPYGAAGAYHSPVSGSAQGPPPQS